MRVILILLICCNTIYGQSLFQVRDSAVIKTFDGLPAKEPFDTARSHARTGKPYVYIISDNDLYDLFGYDRYIRYRDFNFRDFHILGMQQCRQCLLVCHHEQGEMQCHRNKCNKEWVWLVRDNNKAFTEIPSMTKPGHAGPDLPAGRTSFFGDTVIQDRSGMATRLWYTNGNGDCHARFSYSVFADRYHPVLLLKENNYYGGCRGAGFWDFTVSFTEPEGAHYYVKSIVLVERDKE